MFELLALRLMFEGLVTSLDSPVEWACHLRDKGKQALLMSGRKVILTFSRRGKERRKREGGEGRGDEKEAKERKYQR